MKTLVVGASGATGRLLTRRLLELNQSVKIVVRSPENLPGYLRETEGNLEIIVGSILDFTDEEMEEMVKDCDSIASCLGHNLTLKGIYGKPRKLVRDSAIRLSNAAKKSGQSKKVKYVLMNTTGNRNRDLNEKHSLGESIVIGLVRTLLPPQSDNEQAAEFFRSSIGQSNPQVDWCVVRPDGLIDEEESSDYDLHPSPIRSPIFNAGKTSRINVAYFMASLITDQDLWNEWKGKMPVIYNR